MTDIPLPDDDHFARHCSGRKGKNFSDENDGYRQPPWLHGNAFEPSPENPNLSGSWVERLSGTDEQQIERIRQELNNSERDVRPTHNLAVIKVRTVVDIGATCDRDLHVLFTPDLARRLPSHSEIRGVPLDDYLLHQKLADASKIEPMSRNRS